MLQIITFLTALTLTSAALAQPPPREFARCPNGYRFFEGRCHTFGFRDHALRYHQGHFLRHQQPPARLGHPGE